MLGFEYFQRNALVTKIMFSVLFSCVILRNGNFENNLGILCKFTNYLKESCGLGSDQLTFIYSTHSALRDIAKKVGCLLSPLQA